MTQDTNSTQPTRKWSEFQKAIFAEIASGRNTNVVVLARAGSGKTTTVVEAMKYAPKGLRVLFAAFNKKIQEELASRIPAGVDAKTLHSLGLRAVKRSFPRIQIDADAAEKWIRTEVEAAHASATKREFGFVPSFDDPEAKADLGAARKLVSLAKNCNAKCADDVERLALDHGVCAGYLSSETMGKVVMNVLESCMTPERAISYDDMVWLPVVLNLPVDRYDLIFVDEAQDLNATQIALVQKATAKGGRIVAVGDDRQAIYSFRGAASNAINDLVAGLDAVTLPLSISYRCAQAVVELAQQIVPDITPAPSAPAGVVRDSNLDDLLTNAKPGDFVLSRTNRGAVSTCLSLLRRGTPAAVVGRDVGASIAKMVEMAEKKSHVRSIDELAEWLDEWVEKTVATVRKRAARLGKSPDAQIEAANDRVEVLRTISADCTDLTELKGKLTTLFKDDDPRNRVACSTVHKAKGLETDRVWVLVSTWNPKFACTEEDNLRYVAYTRAKRELVLTTTPKERKDGEEE